jgi:hypothetical protein
MDDKPRKTPEEILAMLPPAAFAQQGKFAPKLSFAQRCEILVMLRAGIGRATLAKAYGINRRTITHIESPASPHYKNVREELVRLGPDEFRAQYLTEDGAKRVRKAMIGGEDSGPKQSANRDRGMHTVRNDYCKYDHRIQIEWLPDGELGAGWYFKDLDGPFPDGWFSGYDDESRISSTACLKGAKEAVMDA